MTDQIYSQLSTYTLTVTLDSNPDVVKTIENIEIKENEITSIDVAFGQTETIWIA